MKIRIDNLQPWKGYYIQVRGTGEVTTEWSQTYRITTERDRIAPPPISNVRVSSEQYGPGDDSTYFWYGKSLIVSWDGYTPAEIAQASSAIWDFATYAVRFETMFGQVKTFYTADKSFTLTYETNVATFGGKGCPVFKSIYVYGVDTTKNPSDENGPWADGPFWNETAAQFNSTNIVNPVPEQLLNMSANFESPNCIINWEPNGSVKNIDAELIELTFTDNYSPGSSLGAKTTVTVPYKSSQYIFDYNTNAYYFNNKVGSPNLIIDAVVIDAFGQRSLPVRVSAINEPPPDPAQLSVKPTATPGEYAWEHSSVQEILDYKQTEIYEKLWTEAGDGDPGWTLISTTGNSYLCVQAPNSRRWVKARHVDVFNQTSAFVKPTVLGDYPVKPLSTYIADGVAPSAPTELAVAERTKGTISISGIVNVSWKSDPSDDLLGHVVSYCKASDNDLYDSWTSVNVPATRSYIASVSGSSFTLLPVSYQNFQVGDVVTIVNGGTPIKTTVVSVSGLQVNVSNSLSAITVSGDVSKNTRTAAILSSCTLELQPGTRYKFKVASSDNAQSGEFTSELLFTTSGSPLVAKQPLEVGTWYDSVKIVSYSITSNVVTINLNSPVGVSNGLQAGRYVSVVDCTSTVNGRYKITTASGSAITYSLPNSVSNVSLTNVGGSVTAGLFAIGAKVNAVNDGILLDDNNYWLSDIGKFRVGNSSVYTSDSFVGMEWDSSAGRLTIGGDINARSGNFTGNVFINNQGALVIGQVFEIDTTRKAGALMHSGQEYVWVPIKTIASMAGLVGKKLSLSSSDEALNNKSVSGYIFAVANDAGGKPYIAYWTGTGDINEDKSGYAQPTSGTLANEPAGGSYINGKAYIGPTTSMDSRMLISTDANGGIKYLLSQTGTNLIGGFKIAADRLDSLVQGGSGLGLSTKTTLPSFWAGSNNDPSAAVWRVNSSGTMSLGSSTVTGTFNVGDAGTANGIQIVAGGASVSKMYSGTGAWSNTNTPFYLSSDGQFSLKNKFKIDVSGSNTLVTIGDTAAQQFFFNAGSSPKFYQGTGTYANSNTKVYLDFNGNFSISDFFIVSPSETKLINSGGGAFRIAKGLTGYTWEGASTESFDLTIAHNGSFSSSNSLVLGRTVKVSGSFPADSYYHGGHLLFPSSTSAAESRPHVAGGGKTLLMSGGTGNTNILITNGEIWIDSTSKTMLTSLGETNISSNLDTIMSSRDTYINATGGVQIGSNGFKTPWVPNSGNDTGQYSYVVVAGSTAGEYKFANKALFLNSSSKRYKKDINYLTEDERRIIKDDILYKITRPATFNYRENGQVVSSGIQIGYLAEDFEENGVLWPLTYSNGRPETLEYQKLSLGLIEVAQAHEKEINNLSQTVVQLKERLRLLEEGN